MNVQAQVTALIDEMRGAMAGRDLVAFESASDSLDTLVRAALIPEPEGLRWMKIGFTRAESRLMSHLHGRSGKVVTHVALVDALYHDHIEGGPATPTNTMKVHICKLRKKLVGTPYEVENIPWVGYRLNETGCA